MHFLLKTSQGVFFSNVGIEARHPVTWGVFPGQEIAQPTVIEQDSFLAWKVGLLLNENCLWLNRGHILPQEEAFSVWSQWAEFYPPNSPSRDILNTLQEDLWLVSVLHHDFKRPDALWTFLLDG